MNVAPLPSFVVTQWAERPLATGKGCGVGEEGSGCS